MERMLCGGLSITLICNLQLSFYKEEETQIPKISMAKLVFISQLKMVQFQ